MKINHLALFVTVFFLSLPVLAATVEVQTYPVFQGIPAAETQTAINDIVTDANANGLIKKFGDQKNLVIGFGNSSAYAASAGKVYTASEQEMFSISAGAGGAFMGAVDDFQNIGPDKADPEAGVAANMLIMIGFNPDSIQGMPVKGFLLNGKFGYNNVAIGPLKTQSLLLGLGVDYKVFTPEKGNGAVQLAPVVVGTGVLYTSNSVSFTQDDKFTSTSGTGVTTAYYKLDQSSTLNIATNVITVPIDVYSSVKFIWFWNIFAGVGCDIAMGSTEISVDSNSKLSAYRDAAYLNEIKKDTSEKIALKNSTTKGAPAVILMRTTVGTGFALGAVHLDFPFTYYPTAGYAFAATASVVM